MEKENKNWILRHPIMSIFLLIILLPVFVGFFRGLIGHTKTTEKQTITLSEMKSEAEQKVEEHLESTSKEAEDEPIKETTKKGILEEANDILGEKYVKKTHSPCDFLPDKNVVPTEFRIKEPKEKDITCTQTYYIASMVPEQLIVKISLYDTIGAAKERHNYLIENEKSTRGYTELKNTKECFGVQKEISWRSIIDLYCRWGTVVFEEKVIDNLSHENILFLTKIPQDVVDKVTKAGLY